MLLNFCCYWRENTFFNKTWFGNAGNKIPILPQNNIDIAIFLLIYCEDVLIAAQLTMNEAGLSADSEV